MTHSFEIPVKNIYQERKYLVLQPGINEYKQNGQYQKQIDPFMILIKYRDEKGVKEIKIDECKGKRYD